jgi:uncharacterized membrane protein YGL010W
LAHFIFYLFLTFLLHETIYWLETTSSGVSKVEWISKNVGHIFKNGSPKYLIGMTIESVKIGGVFHTSMCRICKLLDLS